MITDNQVRKLMKSLQQGKTLEVSGAKSDMDVKTARKYRDLGRLPDHPPLVGQKMGQVKV